MNNENNSRIVKNTLFLYIKIFFTIIFSLYISRAIINCLGIENFGIYNVIGGIVSMIVFVQSPLSNASQRYLNIALGENNIKKASCVFNQSISLFFIISILLLIIGEFFGSWFVLNKLVVPEGKREIALIVFHISLINVILLINQIPFISAIIAREKMFLYACIGILDITSKLLIAISLSFIENTDKLILYTSLLCANSFIILILYIIITQTFEEGKFHFYWNKKLAKEMTGFVSFNLFGCTAWSIGNQGIDILLNLFFGPIVNAARGVSNQVNAAINNFSRNFIIAANPQIMKCYANENINEMLSLVQRTSKIAVYIIILVATPILYETDFILTIWLKDVPHYAAGFTRIMLIYTFTEVLIAPWSTVVNATGKIKKLNIYGSLITLSNFPLSYFFLKAGFSPFFPLYIAVLLQFCLYAYTIKEANSRIKFNIMEYLSNLFIPIIKIIIILNLSILLTSFLQIEYIRFIAICFTTLIIGGISVFYIGLSINERAFIIKLIKPKTNI